MSNENETFYQQMMSAEHEKRRDERYDYLHSQRAIIEEKQEEEDSYYEEEAFLADREAYLKEESEKDHELIAAIQVIGNHILKIKHINKGGE